jgi:hypothetical protein
LTIIVLSCASGITATTCGILIGRGGDFLLVAAFAIASVMLASKAFSIAAVYERTFHHIIDRADEYLAVADRACRDLQKVSGAYWRMVDDQTHQTGQKPGDGGVVVPFKR